MAAAQTPVAVPPKLAALLTVQGKDGQPVITPQQRAYFDSLNDYTRGFLYKAVEKEVITKAEHLKVILALELRPQKMGLLLQDNCILCHTDAESQSVGTLFTLAPESAQTPAHLSLKDLVDDVHFSRDLSCAGCHGGDPANESPDHKFVKEWPLKGRAKDRSWILNFCARCHSDPALINRYNPALPTDQLAKYQGSPHGQVLLQKQDQRAPQCVSCHGVHGIRSAKNPLSSVYPKRVPETCGACHSNPKTMAGFTLPDGSPLPTNQLAEYRISVHGRALLERDDFGAPACNRCHGNHAAMPVGLSSVSQSCSLCHVANANLFDGSKHKVAFEQHKWPQCAKCHGNHGIAKTHDAMLGSGPGSLCVECHQQFARNDPECIPAAEYFYSTITQMDSVLKTYSATAERLATKGLDVDPLNDQLNELTDNLKLARSTIHAFSRTVFQQATAPGEKAAQRIVQLVKAARGEYRFRQLGLIASIGLMGLVMVALYVKLRRLERR